MKHSEIAAVVTPNLEVLNAVLKKLNEPDEDGGEIFARHAQFISKIKFVTSPTGWVSTRITANREEDGLPISKRAVVISALPEIGETTTVVFENYEKISEVHWKDKEPPLVTNASNTRFYQPLQYMGKRSDGSVRGLGSCVVAQRCLDTLAEEVIRWIIDGELPSNNWVATPAQAATFVEADNAYFAEKAKQEAMKNI